MFVFMQKNNAYTINTIENKMAMCKRVETNSQYQNKLATICFKNHCIYLDFTLIM
jgi:hypothetical protein